MWRPRVWFNPFKSGKDCLDFQVIEPAMHEAFEEGADAMLRAIIPLVKKIAPSSKLVDILGG